MSIRSLPIIFLFLFVMGCAKTAFPQQESYRTVKTAADKVIKFYDKGMEAFRANNWDKAAQFFEKSTAEDDRFVDGYLLLGEVSSLQSEPKKSIAYFKKAAELAPDYKPKVWYRIGSESLQMLDYQQAISFFEQYLNREQDNSTLRRKAQKFLLQARFAQDAIAHPVPYVPKKLPTTINTEQSEYLPAISAENNQLFFTRMINGQEDFYVSNRVDGEWQTAVPIVELNTPQNEGSQSVSADGRWFAFAAGRRSRGGRGPINFDLYLSEYRNGRWTVPVALPEPINTNGWESQPALSSDGRLLFFVSRRSGGYGGADIWYSRKSESGRWSKPLNAGPHINTAEDDQVPFLHADGRTLYFESEGHPGMGGHDLFMAEMFYTDSFGKAENLGYPINTSANESGIVVSLDGKTGYFATDRINYQSGESSIIDDHQGRNQTDIFCFEMPEKVRPKPVTYVKFKVIDANTKRAVEQAHSVLTYISNGALAADQWTDASGSFLVVLPMGEDYALNVAAPGYVFFSEFFPLAQSSAESQDQSLDRTVKLQIIELQKVSNTNNEKPIVLNNIFFESASAALKSTSRSELNQLHGLLMEHPEMRIEIHGHTDNVGQPVDNMKLSQARAHAVMQYLIDKGISPERLRAKGFGESRPIADNDTPEGRKRNRRSAFIIW